MVVKLSKTPVIALSIVISMSMITRFKELFQKWSAIQNNLKGVKLMAILIHLVHRRLAELHLASEKRCLTKGEKKEMTHCLIRNADLVRELDELKQLSQLAYEMGDMEWHRELCERIKKIRSSVSPT